HHHLRHLHPFPTRRSSDLAFPGWQRITTTVRTEAKSQPGTAGNVHAVATRTILAREPPKRTVIDDEEEYRQSAGVEEAANASPVDRKSTRLNSSHGSISYA